MTTKCSVEGCKKPRRGRGMCQAHYMVWYKNGGKNEPKLRPPSGSGTVTNDGYIRYCIDGRNVMEHVLIAERALGHRLPEGAVVHHVNGKRWDNRQENLVVCPNNSYHLELHARQRRLGITFEEEYETIKRDN